MKTIISTIIASLIISLPMQMIWKNTTIPWHRCKFLTRMRTGTELQIMNCIFRFNNSPNGYDLHNADGATIEIQGDLQIED